MPVIDALAGLGVHSGEPARLGLGAGVRTGWGDEWLQLGPVKVFTDGSVLGRTAQLSEPYEGCPGYHGYLQEDQESLRRRVLDAYAAGWSLALHAVGDAALDLALDVIEEGVTRHGTRPVPNRVEHGAVVRPTRSPGSPDSLWPASYSRTSSRRSVRECGEPSAPTAAPRSHRARSLLDARLPVAFELRPARRPGAPLGGIQAFIERITEDGLPYGPTSASRPGRRSGPPPKAPAK